MDDQGERLGLLRRFHDEGRFLEWAETLVGSTPDVAVTHLHGPGELPRETAVAGMLFGPPGALLGTLAGIRVGAWLRTRLRTRLGVRFDAWYRASPIADRARVLVLGIRIGRTGKARYRFRR